MSDLWGAVKKRKFIICLKTLTLEEVRAVLAEKSSPGHTEEVRGLLAKHGADKLSEIGQEEYVLSLVEEAKKFCKDPVVLIEQRQESDWHCGERNVKYLKINRKKCQFSIEIIILS